MRLKTSSILLVDDDSLVANALARMLRARNYDVSISPDPKSALERCGKMEFKLIITDQRMPVMYGTEFAAMVKPLQPNARIMLISGYCNQDQASEALDLEAIDRLVLKPWDNAELLSAIEEELRAGVTKEWEDSCLRALDAAESAVKEPRFESRAKKPVRLDTN